MTRAPRAAEVGRPTRRPAAAAPHGDGPRRAARRAARIAGDAVVAAALALTLGAMPGQGSMAEAIGVDAGSLARPAALVPPAGWLGSDASDGSAAEHRSAGTARPAASAADGSTDPGSAPEPAPRWRWPVRPPHVITRPFSPPATAYGPGHRGVDIAADPGADVLAPADGTVSFAGVVVDRPVVSIRHADGFVSSVEPVVPTVSAGDRVSAGQVIGSVAAEPRHEPDGGVHLGARLHGDYVDPALLLASLRHAVLLPLDP